MKAVRAFGAASHPVSNQRLFRLVGTVHDFTVIVTHLPNLQPTVSELAAGVADGEALVFGPDGKGGSAFVARIKIEEWPSMR